MILVGIKNYYSLQSIFFGLDDKTANTIYPTNLDLIGKSELKRTLTTHIETRVS